MRIGIVSDIHCNIAGLERALAEMGDVDELICAGDSIFQFRFSNEVVERLRERGARTILGNHEETFFSPGGIRAQQADWIHRDALEYLREQPLELRTIVNGKRLCVVHGSPWEPQNEYIYPHSPTLRRFAEFAADIVILGHTHYQMAERVGRTLVINPGSTGQPRDPRNDMRLSFAILDSETDEVQFCNFPDPAQLSSEHAEMAWTAWKPQDGCTRRGYNQVHKSRQDPWNASLNI